MFLLATSDAVALKEPAATDGKLFLGYGYTIGVLGEYRHFILFFSGFIHLFKGASPFPIKYPEL
ncbi:hypothetical protein, partial [Aeromonas veronii]|uniref:hypothetical protein n=1 Tax=Aeromonas veronii TaxID=654 RepID=UPI003CE54188